MKKFARENGYIILSPLTGRRYWCEDYNEIKGDYSAVNKFAKLGCNYPRMYGAYICENIGKLCELLEKRLANISKRVFYNIKSNYLYKRFSKYLKSASISSEAY